MNDQDWGDWAAHYSAMLGLGSDADRLMLQAWKPEFIHATKSDLDEAFRRLAASDQILRWRAEHRRYLHIHLNEIVRQRQRVTITEIEECEERYRCKECHGSGHVIVPHPKTIRDGVWDFKTEFAVACDCSLGVSRAAKFNAQVIAWNSANEGRKAAEIMPKAWIEHMVPEWRELMAEKKRRMKAATRADEFTEAADRKGPMQVDRNLFAKLAKSLLPKQKPQEGQP